MERWLESLGSQPLPGGLAAAAVAAAMGAALIEKATRITLKRQEMDAADRAALETVLHQSKAQATELVHMAAVDEQAYRAVLETRGLAPDTEEYRQARQIAAEIPIQVAEACQALLDKLAGLRHLCWPTVQMELQTGGWLLEVGVRAGRLAAEANIRAWGEQR